jgi:hypothetical protein
MGGENENDRTRNDSLPFTILISSRDNTFSSKKESCNYPF